MDITLNQIVGNRWNELPLELRAIYLKSSFENALSEIALYYKLDSAQSIIFKNEVLLILFLFESLPGLSKRLTEMAGIQKEIADLIIAEVELVIFDGALDYLNDVAKEPTFIGISDSKILETQDAISIPTTQPKETLELRPNNVPTGVPKPPGEGGARPLTRDELLSALSMKRTMAEDIKTAQSHDTSPVQVPIIGYASSYKKPEGGEPIRPE